MIPYGKDGVKTPFFLRWRRAKEEEERAGFTLVEVMIAVTILLVFIIGGARFFENSFKNWQANYAQLEIQQSGRIAMDGMTTNVRQASAATVIIDPLAVPANSKITFQVMKDTGTRTITYSLAQEKMRMELNSVETITIDNVQELYFAKRNPATVFPDEDQRCIYIRLILKKNKQQVTLESYTHLKNE